MSNHDEDLELDRRLRQEILSEPVDVSGVEQRLRRAIAPSHMSRVIRAVGAAAAILLFAVLAFSTWRALVPHEPVQVCSDAARDHLREIVHQEPRRWTSDVSAIDRLAARIGLASSPLSRIILPGYRFERGKLCRLDGHVFLHLVYSNGAREFSLFLGNDPKLEADRYAADFGEQHVATVRSSQARALVVTGDSSSVALNFAQLAARAL